MNDGMFLFNDTPNTFYLWLYDVIHLSMVFCKYTLKIIDIIDMNDGMFLFNDTPNTFYLWLYDVIHLSMVFCKYTLKNHIYHRYD